MNKLVSVIIPFFNRVDWLTEALESVLAQTYSPVEIIVVNDGSDENMNIFLKQYSNRIKYYEKKNQGPASARNYGIEIANGEFIAFLDSDDIWMPRKLENQITYMERENLLWSHTAYKTFDDSSGRILRKIHVSDFVGDIFPVAIMSSPIATPCVVIRSSVLRQNSLLRFPEYMRYGQDSGLWLRMAAKFPIGVVNEYLTLVRMRGKNASRRARVQIKARAQIYDLLESELGDAYYSKLGYASHFFFSMCKKEDKLLERITREKNERLVELISRFLYLPSWLFFKMEKNRLLRIQNRGKI